MITFVTWKWHTAGSPRRFFSRHVNVLYSMIARCYRAPFRFVCVTDDPAKLDPRIEAMALPVRFDELRSPHGARFPNCYCRLWNFSREAAVLGERIFQLDVDVIITGDLMPLLDRPEDFVGWSDRRFQQNKIAGGAYLLRTGSMPEIWEDFDPARSPALAFADGHFGSDQGWMSYKIKKIVQPSEADSVQSSIGFWKDGASLIKINWTDKRAHRAPPGAKLVFTNGVKPPWAIETQMRYPWVKNHWRL